MCVGLCEINPKTIIIFVWMGLHYCHWWWGHRKKHEIWAQISFVLLMNVIRCFDEWIFFFGSFRNTRVCSSNSFAQWVASTWTCVNLYLSSLAPLTIATPRLTSGWFYCTPKLSTIDWSACILRFNVFGFFFFFFHFVTENESIFSRNERVSFIV